MYVKKNFTSLILARAYSVKIGVILIFSLSGLKDEKLIKKANLHEQEAKLSLG